MANKKSDEQQFIITDSDYRQWLQELKSRYRQAQIKAASRVNEELLRYYWQLGADINARGDENRYGTRFYDTLSRDLKEIMPEVDGFSRKNLQNATRFYRLYASIKTWKQPVSELESPKWKQVVSNTNRQQPADESIFQIPWGHHVLLLSKCSDNIDKALFYVHKTLENQWSRALLLNMMGDNSIAHASIIRSKHQKMETPLDFSFAKKRTML